MRLGASFVLVIGGGTGLTLGLFLYFGKLALDEAVRLVFGPG